MTSLQQFTTGLFWIFTRNVLSLAVLLAFFSCVRPSHTGSMMPSWHLAFSATRSSSLLGGSQKALTFDRLLVNLGGDFNPDTGVFWCRVAGAYYFTFTVGKYPKKLLSVMLVKNKHEVQAIAYNESNKQGRKVQSQSVMISLMPMDSVWLMVQQSSDYALYSSIAPYITFSGYLVYPENTSTKGYPNNHLYQPELSIDCSRSPENLKELRSAFSVARSSSALGKTRRQEKRVALKFDVEYVNLGGHFNKSSGHFTCRVPGVYFFAFTVGKHPKRALSVKLMKGSGEVQAMVFNEDTSRKREMQSQSLLLLLNRGETVWLYSQQDERYGVYSNQGRYTTFTGFLVYSVLDLNS